MSTSSRSDVTPRSQSVPMRQEEPVTVTVYTKPLCVQCSATHRALDKQGVSYVDVDVTADADALAKIKAMGYLQAPVLITADGQHWSGFRPDLIQQLNN